MADAPAEAPAPKKKKPSLGKQVTSGVRRTVDAGRTVLSTMERGVKKTYDALLKENLKASSPMTSSLWYLLKHPLTRSLTTIVVLLLNLFVYYGDPATFSNSESYGTMIGDIWHGWFEPEAGRLVFTAVARDDLSWAVGFICGYQTPTLVEGYVAPGPVRVRQRRT